MGFLTVNHNEANTGNKQEYERLPEGEYEVVISEIEKRKSSSNNDMLKVTLTVRADIEQEGKKRKVWDYLVDTEKAKFKFQQLAKALEIPNSKSFDTIDSFAKEILYKAVRVQIKHERSTYNDKVYTNERVAVYKPATKPYVDQPTTASSSTPF
jgi:hypothetical protein